MTNALKGAMLSGLVIPGLGQIMFKQYIRGSILMALVMACLLAITIKIVQIALIILSQIQFVDGTVTFSTIVDIATQSAQNASGMGLAILFGLILALWIVGTLDAYAIGRKLDLENAEDTTVPS